MFANTRQRIFALGVATAFSQLIGALPPALAADGDAKSMQKLLHCGEAKLRQQRYADADKVFEQALKVDGDSLPAHADRATALAGMKQYQKALNEYDNALALVAGISESQRNAWTHKLKLARGKALHQLASYDKAVEDLTAAIGHNPTGTEEYICRAAAYSELAKHDEALNDLGKALQLEPGNTEALLQRAMVHKERNDTAQAIADLNSAAKLDPRLIHHRADFYREQGKHDQAIADYSCAIDAHKGQDRAEHYFSRGLVYEDCDKHRLAISDYDLAIELDPKQPFYLVHRGNSFFGVSDFKHAIADYATALSLAPEDSETYFKRAQAYQLDGQKEKALADFDKAVSLSGSEPTGRYLVKRALLRSAMGDHANAINDITSALAVAKDAPEYYFDRGLEYNAQGKFSESVEDLTKCITMQPHFACAYKNRGLARAHMGDQQGAMTDLTASSRLYETEGDRHGCAEVNRLIFRIQKAQLRDSGAMYASSPVKTEQPTLTINQR